jgi:hypothetical protein
MSCAPVSAQWVPDRPTDRGRRPCGDVEAATFSTVLAQYERNPPLYAPLAPAQREARPERLAPAMEIRTEASQRRHQRQRSQH